MALVEIEAAVASPQKIAETEVVLKLIIEDDEGRKTVVPFVRDEITVGRQEGNTIRLTERNVSRKHARLLRQNGHVVVEDLGSYNGIRVNGEKIAGKHQVHDGDLIQIGDYDLAIQTEGQAAERPPAPPPVLAPTERATVQNLEPVTEASAELVDDNEPTGPLPGETPDARRQATSIIRVDQIEGNPNRQVVDLDPNDAPRLVVLNTEFAGREFACVRSELKIGRTEDNDIGLDHRSLSRTHAKVVREANGEWRVIDMQSANGTAVNGETYAQAALRHGDVITLGHLKLKFIGAGEAFRFVPGKDYERDRGGDVARGTSSSGGGAKSKLPMFVGGGVAVAAVLSLGIWALTRGPDETIKPIDQTQVVDGPVKTGPDTVKPPDKPPEPQIGGAEEKIAAAKEAIAAREFDKAADILDTIKSSDGTRPKQVESMLDEVNAEILFKKNLASAQKAFEGGKNDEALRLIEESGGTAAYTDEFSKLKEKVDAAKSRVDDKTNQAALLQQKKEDDAAAKQAALDAKKADAEEQRRTDAEARKAADEQKLAAANAAAQKKADVKSAAGKKTSGVEEAKKLFDEGFAIMKSKQYPEAANIFRRCLEQDSKHAECHLYLGVSYAKLKQIEKGAYHYKQFVQIAPNHEQAAKVRKMIEQYEESKKKGP